MEKLGEGGVRTRSMAKLKPAEAALLAPAKLCVPQREPAATPPVLQTVQESHTVPRIQNAANSNVALGNTPPQIQQALTTEANSMSQGLAVDEVPMDLDGVTPPDGNSRSPQAGFRVIDNASIICCGSCNIIFQRVSDQPQQCPLCSAKKVHKRQYQEDLKTFQYALESNTKQIKTLQKSFDDIRDRVAQISEHTTVCEHSIGIPARALNQGMAAAQSRELTEKMLEMENINVTDLIARIDSKRAQLDQIQGRFDQLINAFTKSVEIAEASAAPLGLGNEHSHAAGTSIQDGDLGLCVGLSEPSSERGVMGEERKAVLLAGGSNVLRSRNVIKNMLRRDHRLTVHGDPRHNLSDSVAFCRDWLQNKDCALVILHSGLNDIFSIEKGTKEDINNTVEGACSAIRSLSSECKKRNAKLVVCSIPEVVDFRRRIDWRQAAFAVNAVLKGLSCELGYDFLDIASTVTATSYLMTVDGIYYNKHGQVHAMSAVARSIASWLNIEIGTLGHELRNGKQSSDVRPNGSRYRQTPDRHLERRFSRPREPRYPITPVNRLPFQGQPHNYIYDGVRNQSRGSALPARLSTAPWVHAHHKRNGVFDAAKLGQHYLNPWLPGAVPWS